MELVWTAGTYGGPGAGRNCDAYGFGPLDRQAQIWFAAVADGVGGHAAAHVASRLAVRTLRRSLREDPPARDPRGALRRCLAQVHQAIASAGRRRREWEGMSTTLTAAIVTVRHITLGHVGDSRAYLLTADGFERLTRDHSLVGSLVHINAVSEREALNHPGRHLLMAAVGARGGEPAVETRRLSWQGDELLMLCTDGLVATVTEAQLEETARRLMTAGDFSQFAAALVRRANRWGGDDNVTVLACRRDADKERGA